MDAVCPSRKGDFYDKPRPSRLHRTTATNAPHAPATNVRVYMRTSNTLGVMCPFQPKVMVLTNIGRKTAVQTTHISVRRVRASDGSTG